jgi:hypothetical protein
VCEQACSAVERDAFDEEHAGFFAALQRSEVVFVVRIGLVDQPRGMHGNAPVSGRVDLPTGRVASDHARRRCTEAAGRIRDSDRHRFQTSSLGQ